MAGSVQKALGVPACAAMDVSAGCTGFLYALVTAASLMETLQTDAAIVVASEVMTKYLDWTDRSTCVLFGDGAGALVLRRSEVAHVLSPILSATADVDEVITLKKEARSTPFTGHVEDVASVIKMKGADVFAYAVGVLERTLVQLSKRVRTARIRRSFPSGERKDHRLRRALHGFTPGAVLCGYLELCQYILRLDPDRPVRRMESAGWTRRPRCARRFRFGADQRRSGDRLDDTNKKGALIMQETIMNTLMAQWIWTARRSRWTAFYRGFFDGLSRHGRNAHQPRKRDRHQGSVEEVGEIHTVGELIQYLEGKQQ
jgi:hypothetical protein